MDRLENWGARVANNCLVPILFTSLLSSVGCSGEPVSDTREVANTRQAITNQEFPYEEFEDGSGTMRLRVTTCDWTDSATVNCAFCSVDDGWARVGGGAEIENETPGGATLRYSFPAQDAFMSDNEDNNGAPCTGVGGGDDASGNATWVAGSRGSEHRLRAYVIGLQLLDDSGTPFAPAVAPNAEDRVSLVEPDADGFVTVDCLSSVLPSGFMMIGGGGEVLEHTVDGFLTESRPIVAASGEVGWRATLRKFGPEDAHVKCYALGIDACPDEWNGQCLTYPVVRSLTTAPSSGYNTASEAIGASFIPTSIGGLAINQGDDARYLADLIPFSGTERGYTVRSKAGAVANSGATIGATFVVGRAGALYNFNSIRFNHAGTALHRPDSFFSPLEQTAGYPLDEDGRWHLDPIGDDYLVRNGNPDEGTDCAYWSQFTNNVHVAPCETTDAFRWTRNHYPGSSAFRLQNVASGLCIDNGDQGFVSSGLTLEDCITEYSFAQALFLDAFDWPPASIPDSTLAFEVLSSWSSGAPLSLNYVRRTQGDTGLSVGGAGHRLLNSVPVRTPVSGFAPTLLLDVFVPDNQPNPYWLGAVQTYASCPSANVYNLYLGQVELTGRPTGSFSTLHYPLSTEAQSLLSEARSDCFFSVAVNTNSTPEPVVIDNLRFGP